MELKKENIHRIGGAMSGAAAKKSAGSCAKWRSQKVS